jgi:Flp pilus assembly pilin Flp
MNLLKKFVRDEAGMETVEWAIMASLIVAGVATIVVAIGGKVSDAFNNLNTNMGAPAS